MSQKSIWIVLALAIFPTGIRAYDPFSLHAQSRPPQKPRFQTRIEPGDTSAAAKHACKDPAHLKLEYRRVLRVQQLEH